MNTSCPQCGYSLASLPDSEQVVCPECGTRWSREQVLRHDPSRAPWTWLIALALTPLVMVAVGGLGALASGLRGADTFHTASLESLAGGFLWATGWEARILRRSMTAGASVHQRVLLLPYAAIFGLIVTTVSALALAIFLAFVFPLQ